MAEKKKRRSFFKLDRLNLEQRRETEEMYARGMSYEQIAQRVTELGLPVTYKAVARYCQERIENAAERAARLLEQAAAIAKALAPTNTTEMAAKARVALHAVFFNLLNDASEESLTDVAHELREMEKVDVARERVAVEKQKVRVSQKQLELKNKELEARLAAARQAVAQAERAAEPAPGGASGAGKIVLPSDVLEKLKEAYGIA